MKKIIQSNIFFYMTIVLGATVIFFGTYGHKVLNPSYLELCYLRGDWTQHYYGWVGFRNSDWQFPFGMYNNNTYPDSTSIIYTDSIPIFAVIFKVVRGVLPSHFQYFGLFTLTCYIAQAVVVSRIIVRVTNNKVFSYISTLIFSFMPIMLQRAFVHEALCAQFLVVLMIETLLVLQIISRVELYTRIGVCALLASGIHMYFVLICGIVLISVCFLLVLYKRYMDSIIVLFGYVGVAAFVIWVEGGFSSGINTSKDTRYDLFGININTFFSPFGKSSILKDLPRYAWGEEDASQYLGFGVIALLAISVIVSFVCFNKIKALIKSNIKVFIAIMVSVLIATIFAIIPNVAFNDRLLFSVELPLFMEEILGVFRCHGRVMWIDVYYLMILFPILIYKCLDKSFSYTIIIIAIVLQIVDLRGYLEYKYHFVNESHREESEFELTPEIIGFGVDDSIKHIILYKKTFDYFDDKESPKDVYAWAIENGKTSNYIYLARDDEERYVKRLQDAMENPREDYLYILSNQDEDVCKLYGLNYKKYGRYIFAQTKSF